MLTVTASGSSLGPSKLTQLLREIEKLNLRILGVKEEEIEEIVQGFGKEATVVVREFDITGLQPFVLFLMRKHQEKQDSHMMLANNKFIQFLENECYKEERLMQINNLEKTFPMK